MRTEWNIQKSVVKGSIYLLALVFFMGPSSWLILSSFDRLPRYSWSIPSELTLDHYIELFTQSDIRLWLGNSLVLGLGTMAVTVVLSTIAAYPLSRLQFRGKTLLMYLVLISRVMPITAVIIPLFSIAIFLKMINTFWGVILILSAMQLPIGLWIFKDFIDTIPLELEEAAWLDGCGRWEAIRFIIVPLLGPPIVVVGLLSFLAGWGDFLIPLILLRTPDHFPIAMGLYRAFGNQGNVDLGFLTTTSVIYSVPSIALYLFSRKYLIKGIAVS
jgi:multiple sugar transport system permease protein